MKIFGILEKVTKLKFQKGSKTVEIEPTTQTLDTALSIPDVNAASDEIVLKTTAVTMANKTLTSPVLNTGVSGTAVDTDATMAANSDTILASQKATKSHVSTHAGTTTGVHGVGAGSVVGTTLTQALTNKTLIASSTQIADSSTNPKAIVFDPSGATANKTATIVSSHSDNRTITLPNATDTLVGRATTDVLTNKDIDGGTASDSLRITIPKNSTANLAGLTKKEATLVFDTTTKKLNVADGAAWKVVGGGLITEAKGTGNFNAEAGKWYLVDMSGASADSTITLPAGAAESVIQVSVKNNPYPTYKLIVDGNTSETIWYNDTANANVEFGYEEMTATFAWDSNDSHWIVAVSQTPLSGTWSGSLDMTGTLKVDTIQAHTSGAGVAIQGRTNGTTISSGYVGEKISGTGSRGFTSQTASTTGWALNSSVTSCSVNTGTWLVTFYTGISVTSGTNSGARIAILTTDTSDGWAPTLNLSDANSPYFGGAATTGTDTRTGVVILQVPAATTYDLRVKVYVETMTSFTGSMYYYVRAVRIA